MPPPRIDTPVGLGLSVTVRTLLLIDQRLAVRDGDLVIIGMNFTEGQEAMPVAAIIDKGGLQRRLDACHLGKVDVASELPAAGGLEIEFFNAVSTHHDHPGLFRVGGVDEHLVGH